MCWLQEHKHLACIGMFLCCFMSQAGLTRSLHWFGIIGAGVVDKYLWICQCNEFQSCHLVVNVQLWFGVTFWPRSVYLCVRNGLKDSVAGMQATWDNDRRKPDGLYLNWSFTGPYYPARSSLGVNRLIVRAPLPPIRQDPCCISAFRESASLYLQMGSEIQSPQWDLGVTLHS